MTDPAGYVDATGVSVTAGDGAGGSDVGVAGAGDAVGNVVGGSVGGCVGIGDGSGSSCRGLWRTGN